MQADERGFGRGALAALIGVLAITLVGPETANAATTCSYSAGTKTLTVAGDPEVGTQLDVSSTLGSQDLLVRHLTTGSSEAVDCGATTPTQANTDTIEVDHSAPDRHTRLVINNIEQFGPGVFDEGAGIFDCPDEIEILVDLGAGADEIRLVDGDILQANPPLVLGSAGVDRNATSVLCDDLELAATDVDYSVSSQEGDDFVSGQGGNAAGDPLITPLEADGGLGRDVIRGGNGSDRLDGSLGGKDKLFGMGGNDGLFAEDGKRDAKIDCGPGLKVNEFAVRDGKDPKAKSC
jgi:Ca2+-binding RTX toxin-like protein